MRVTGKGIVLKLGRMALRAMPAPVRYRVASVLERLRYRKVTEVHELPGIFHYWSNKYLRPVFERYHFTDPENFFLVMCLQQLQTRSGTARLISIGSGNCDVEAKLARALVDSGVDDFELHCLDFNQAMLDRGAEHAAQLGVSEKLNWVRQDFNDWKPEGQFDVVLANQSLHHVVNLEGLFDAVYASLREDGLFLINDMIGRNGHQRWPEALQAMLPLWNRLPERYHYNNQSKQLESQYVDRDYSTHGFEGVRAQDILPLLVDRFAFHTFLPFGNVVFPFIDRAFGGNFDAESVSDQAFIDEVHAIDEAGFKAGKLTPNLMIAAVGKGQYETRLREPYLTPQACIRRP
ncbi:MAG: hypothetical protein DHS20C11_02290 [Lysobacteraceae bacterium]|nr:MAG: hypothetical protein DHS20C11_02290 [Xanthomonadaceae bacterium]